MLFCLLYIHIPVLSKLLGPVCSPSLNLAQGAHWFGFILILWTNKSTDLTYMAALEIPIKKLLGKPELTKV